MADFILSCCSTADLPKAYFEKRGISYICFHYSLDGVDYDDDLGQSMPFEEFYEAMERGAETKTSQINMSEYLNYFSKMLEQGKDILHLTLSSGISATYNSAENAAMIARERFPGRKVYVVDSLGASSGYGLIMDTLADMRDKGADIDTLHQWTLANRLHMHHWFFSTDLSAYVRGGRISKTAGVFGTMLSICPLMNMDHLGRLIPRSKIRTKKRVIAETVNRMEKYAENGLDYSGKCFISQSACYEDARQVADLVEERFKKLHGKVMISSIGTTIGSHTGPGTVALFFWGTERVD